MMRSIRSTNSRCTAKQITLSWGVGLLLVVLLPSMAASSSCAFLPDAVPVEYELPVDIVIPDTKLKFIDIIPVVIRKVSPTPKITITRYSIAPTIQVDETDGSLIISSKDCSGSSSGTSAAATMANGGWKWGLTAAAMCLAANGHLNAPQRPLVVAAGLLVAASSNTFSPWTGAAAAEQSTSCAHTVEIVMEGPATYRGAVETCEAEVKEIGHCPNPFPTFASCDPSPALSCQIAVVGAGAGALYAALR
jgi:hypothetical protein